MRKAIDVLAEDGCDLLRNHVRREVRYNLVGDHGAHHHSQLGGLGVQLVVEDVDGAVGEEVEVVQAAVHSGVKINLVIFQRLEIGGGRAALAPHRKSGTEPVGGDLDDVAVAPDRPVGNSDRNVSLSDLQ